MKCLSCELFLCLLVCCVCVCVSIVIWKSHVVYLFEKSISLQWFDADASLRGVLCVFWCVCMPNTLACRAACRKNRKMNLSFRSKCSRIIPSYLDMQECIPLSILLLPCRKSWSIDCYLLWRKKYVVRLYCKTRHYYSEFSIVYK